MNRLVVAASLALAAFEPGRLGAEPAPRGPSVAECAQVTAEARPNAYGGYYHVVVLANGCKKSVRCEVWTDVDPTPHHTLVAEPAQTSEVAIRLSSPSRIVSAGKACAYQ